jgi:arylsulfatase A-like enzyme
LGHYAHYDWPEEMKLYAAMVSRLDGYVGEILATLDRLDLAQDTLVIFSSDNGPVGGKRCEFFHSAGSLRGAKSSLYEGGIRVPTIVRWPGRVPAGRVSHTPWAFVDLFPTLAALAGAEPPSGLDGQNITQELLGKTAAGSERSFYWELPRNPMWQAARHGRWKVVRLDPAQPLELYDLAEDPGETRNVASAHPRVAADLERYLNKEHTPSPHWPETVQRHSSPQPHGSAPSLLNAGSHGLNEAEASPVHEQPFLLSASRS